jgi:UDP-glucose 4-epimerase
MSSGRARYLVTGGAGFVGSNIVAALVRSGERVRAFDNLATGSWSLVDRLVGGSEQVERVTGDIRDVAALARAMEGVEIVFHQAALASVPRSVEDPTENDEVNTHGTVKVLDTARRQGVRRLVFAASSAVYGDGPESPKHEGLAPSPLSPYAVAKLTAEYYLRVFASLYGLETVGLRYFNIFGPNQLPNGPYAAAIPRFLHAAVSGGRVTVYGDGEQTRDFCFVDNAVRANLLAAHSPKKLAGEVVNIAGGRSVSLNGVLSALGRVVGAPLKVDYVDPKPGDVRHSLADISRAHALLGYEPQVRWEDGLAPTHAFLKALHERGLESLGAAGPG